MVDWAIIASLLSVADQAFISWILLVSAYLCGRSLGTDLPLAYRAPGEKTPGRRPAHAALVDINALIMGSVYGLSAFLYGIEYAHGSGDDGGHAGADASVWLRNHTTPFWFLMTLHQVLVCGILLFEIKQHRGLSLGYLIAVAVLFIQWCVGLFSPDPVGGAVVALVGEPIVLCLVVVYVLKLCACGLSPSAGGKHSLSLAPDAVDDDTRARWKYGLVGWICYCAALLPMLFVGLSMQTPNRAIFVTTLFGALFLWCQGKTIQPFRASDKFSPSPSHLDYDPPRKPSKRAGDVAESPFVRDSPPAPAFEISEEGRSTD